MKGFIKRLVPFLLTFAVGMLVASFFVTISAPKFQFKRGWKHRDYHRLRYENKMQKERIRQLERELNEQRFGDIKSIELNVAPLPPMPPPPPKAPAAPHRY